MMKAKRFFYLQQHKGVSIFAIIILSCFAIYSQEQSPVFSDQRSVDRVRAVRLIETSEVGIFSPVGIAFSPKAKKFLILERQKSRRSVDDIGQFVLVSPFGEKASLGELNFSIDNPINIAYDNHTNQLIILLAGKKRLVELAVGRDGIPILSKAKKTPIQKFGIDDPQGIAIDPETGDLVVLDSAGPRVFRINRKNPRGLKGKNFSEIDLQHTGLVGLQGIAVDPLSGNFQICSPGENRLYEVTKSGRIIANRLLPGSAPPEPGDVAFAVDEDPVENPVPNPAPQESIGLAFAADEDLVEIPALMSLPQGMTFAPSGDLTDDPGQMNLYIADADGSGQIMEVSFNQPVPLESTAQASLIQTIRTSRFSPPSPDPAGITYLNASDSLLISDSEVNEMPIFRGINLFEISRTGFLIDTAATTSFSNEPTGVTVNPDNGHLFFSDDRARKVFEVNPGPDGRLNTGDDIVTSLGTRSFDCFDPEGVAFDTKRGVLFIVDGVNSEVYRVAPGNNGVFDGESPDGDDRVSHFDTSRLGVTDVEGIAYDSDGDSLFIVGKPEEALAQITTTGLLIQMIDISAANAEKPSGLSYARGSVKPSVKNLYIADRALDHDLFPNVNDGKIYEVSLPLITPSNLPPEVNAGRDKTVMLPNAAVLNGTVTDDGKPSGVLIISWEKISGPGTVVFDDATSEDTTAAFSKAGSYVLRLTADDSELTRSDKITVTVEGANEEQITEIRVGAGSDDAEQRSSGRMVLNSSDLELVFDSGSNQTVGMRFNRVTIPRDSTIIKAFIQFKVDEVTSGATSLTIQGQATNNAGTFTSSANNISNRQLTATAISWSPKSWLTKGRKSSAQRTPNIAAVIQEIVDRNGWSSGNSLCITINGTGERVAESFEGDKNGAPLLHIEYIPSNGNVPTVEARVSAGSDDAEELASGSMRLNSSDIELVFDSGGNQTVGIRFQGLTIPRQAEILDAYVQFQADEVNSGGTSLTIRGERRNNAATFIRSNGNITSRPLTSAAVSWSPPPWTTVGQRGINQRTPDISSVIQQIVDRSGWSSGNSLVIIMKGSGERTAESFNGNAAGAPLLHVEYMP